MAHHILTAFLLFLSPFSYKKGTTKRATTNNTNSAAPTASTVFNLSNEVPVPSTTIGRETREPLPKRNNNTCEQPASATSATATDPTLGHQ